MSIKAQKYQVNAKIAHSYRKAHKNGKFRAFTYIAYSLCIIESFQFEDSYNPVGLLKKIFHQLRNFEFTNFEFSTKLNQSQVFLKIRYFSDKLRNSDTQNVFFIKIIIMNNCNQKTFELIKTIEIKY